MAPTDWRELIIVLSRVTGWQPSELMRMTWSEIREWEKAVIALKD